MLGVGDVADRALNIDVTPKDMKGVGGGEVRQGWTNR